MKRRAASMILALALLAGAGVRAQTLQSADLQRVQAMLKSAREVLRDFYYDRKYHGVDLGAAYDECEAQLKTAPSLNVGMTIVAGFLEKLHDSHVRLLPPPRPYDFDYGYRLKAIGEGIFVTGVRPGSDADGKLRAGDEVVLVNNGRATRPTFSTMQYLLNVLQPQPATQLVVRDPAGQERTALVATSVTAKPGQGPAAGSAVAVDFDEMLRQARETKAARSRTVEQGGVLIWQLPAFDRPAAEIDDVFDKAKGRRALIIDLRGNPGGYVASMQHVLSHLFTRDVTIGRNVMRDRKTNLEVDGDTHAFTGTVVVVIDSASASAAEILARVIQLEHRGTVIGDRSAGAVMEARVIPLAQGKALKMLYAISVTIADLVMSDGASLEGIGVMPDELLLPTAQDLALGRDPVLSRAAKLAGLDLDPLASAKLFPFEWK